MATNKVVFGDTVIIDLTGLTVTPETLAEGVVAMNSKGEIIVGTAKVFTEAVTLGTSKLGATILTN